MYNYIFSNTKNSINILIIVQILFDFCYVLLQSISWLNKFRFKKECILNENQLTIVKEYEVDKPLNHKIDSIIDKCMRDCYNNFFLTFYHICVYDIKFTNIGNNGLIKLTISDKNMSLYELNKKCKIAFAFKIAKRFYI